MKLQIFFVQLWSWISCVSVFQKLHHAAGDVSSYKRNMFSWYPVTFFVCAKIPLIFSGFLSQKLAIFPHLAIFPNLKSKKIICTIYHNVNRKCIHTCCKLLLVKSLLHKCFMSPIKKRSTTQRTIKKKDTIGLSKISLFSKEILISWRPWNWK